MRKNFLSGLYKVDVKKYSFEKLLTKYVNRLLSFATIRQFNYKLSCMSKATLQLILQLNYTRSLYLKRYVDTVQLSTNPAVKTLSIVNFNIPCLSCIIKDNNAHHFIIVVAFLSSVKIGYMYFNNSQVSGNLQI